MTSRPLGAKLEGRSCFPAYRRLERYIHAEDSLPPLVRAGLVQVQFESIHPYLDGNGRVGRLLIALLLEHWKLLGAPLLYLSLHFKRRRPDYYRLLNEVRRTGNWEAWSRFFLEGVAEIAEESATTARDLYRLVTRDRDRVLTARGRRSPPPGCSRSCRGIRS